MGYIYARMIHAGSLKLSDVEELWLQDTKDAYFDLYGESLDKPLEGSKKAKKEPSDEGSVEPVKKVTTKKASTTKKPAAKATTSKKTTSTTKKATTSKKTTTSTKKKATTDKE